VSVDSPNKILFDFVLILKIFYRR